MRTRGDAVLGTFAVGVNPNGIAFDGASLWVANVGSNTVSRLRASDGATPRHLRGRAPSPGEPDREAINAACGPRTSHPAFTRGGILTPAPGVRFADFSWRPRSAEAEVAEIAEFASDGDTRLVAIFFSGSPPETEHLSSGILMATRGPWLWRVWSISESGAVAFSSARSFEY